jgi:hypothetical protein
MSRMIIASAASFETDEVICRLQRKGLDLTRIITGVGMTEAAMISARTRELVTDRDVIFCCTAGVIGDFDRIKIFSAGAVELRSWDIRNGKAELLTNFDPVLRLSPAALSLPDCHVLCSLGVSTVVDDAVDFNLTKGSRTLLETIELYAVARSWLPLARSFTAIVATTNATGSRARSEWQANFKEAASLTGALLEELLPRLHQH